MWEPDGSPGKSREHVGSTAEQPRTEQKPVGMVVEEERQRRIETELRILAEHKEGRAKQGKLTKQGAAKQRAGV